MEKLNFRIIDLNRNLDLPLVRETGWHDWISFGTDNDFPGFLTDVFLMKSITHKTIINRKVKMIAGEGFKYPETNELKLFWENHFDDNLDEILYKISFDLELYGGFSLGVRWSKDGERISEIYHIPFESVRVDKNNGVEGIPDYYWISEDWKNHRKFIPKKIQGFSKKYKENKSQVLYVKEYQPGSRFFYPIPSYYSSINWILAEYEISNFHRASIQNGFNAGFILNFATGVPSEEEMKRAYKEIEEKYTGSFNAGKFILTFSDGKDQEPTLEPIPLQDTDARYTDLNDLIRQNIFVSSEVTNPSLFGIETPGKLGTKDEMLESLEIFQSVYINYKQNLIQSVFNKLKYCNDIDEDLIIEKYQLDIKKITE